MNNTQPILKKANELILSALKKSLLDQGHYLTGALERSLTSKVTADTLTGSAFYYLWILEKGVAPGRMVIGNKSITALTAYVQKRMGYDSKRAKQVAFAILKTQQKEGIPTHNANRYSSTGRRTSVLTQTFALINPALDRIIFSGIDELIDIEFNKQKTQTV